VVRAFDQLLHRGDLEGCVGVLSNALLPSASAASEEDDNEEDTRGGSEGGGGRSGGGGGGRGGGGGGGGGGSGTKRLAKDVGHFLNPMHKDFLRACRDARRLDLALSYAQCLPGGAGQVEFS
jgi:hypothetical protein